MKKAVSLIKQKVPWWLKMTVKLSLALIPYKHHIFRSVGLYRHGAMDNAEYARSVYQKHYSAVSKYLPNAPVVLELGPGDSVLSALIARLYGASRTILVDSGNFAIRNLNFYLMAQRKLITKHSCGQLESCTFSSFDELLNAWSSEYLTSGLLSLKMIDSNAIDFIFSNAVLEHVRYDEFHDTLYELSRILKNGGLTSHAIDFKDHLGYSLHSLKFSHSLWESNYFSKAGFYTNRIRYEDILNLFKRYGLKLLSADLEKWDHLPVKRESLNVEFKSRSDLDISYAHVVLQKL